MAEEGRQKRYNPRKRRHKEKMVAMRQGLICWVLLGSALAGFRTSAAQSPSPWEKPASSLTDQIAGIMGPGQAQLTIRNFSSIQAGDLPGIRKVIEQDLKARGVAASGTESANSIRVTLSENARERLWVAEVVQGNETRVAMVEVDAGAASPSVATERVLLRRQTIITSSEPVLAALEISGALIVLEPKRIIVYSHAVDGFREQQKYNIDQVKQLARDPHGVLLGYGGGSRFEAWIPGVQCSGSNSSTSPNGVWNIQCRASDDPWAITQPPFELTDFGGQTTQENVSIMPIQAFYNSSRNYFTGVLVPGIGTDLRPFYSLAIIPRLAGQSALLVTGIDGKVQMLDNRVLKPVAGTRDWGSDFAVLHSGCGTGTQVIASQSGEAASDSLRAYEIPALEAVGVSAPLRMDGTVTALWTTQDGKGVMVVVRNTANEYEVDRVTALCN